MSIFFDFPVKGSVNGKGAQIESKNSEISLYSSHLANDSSHVANDCVSNALKLGCFLIKSGLISLICNDMLKTSKR